ncbi:uncharacterized protein LOC144770671 isoform X2 [Lissotriton helveticus]
MLLRHLLPAALLAYSVVVERVSLQSTSLPDTKTSAPEDDITVRIPASAATGSSEDYVGGSLDDDDNATEGSADGKEDQGNKLKADMENEHRMKGTIIITCSVVGSVVLLVAGHCPQKVPHLLHLVFQPFSY